MLTLFFAIIGEDVLVELRQHDDYVSGKENLERFWVAWFLKFDVNLFTWTWEIYRTIPLSWEQ